jgi:hypothetical protein
VLGFFLIQIYWYSLTPKQYSGKNFLDIITAKSKWKNSKKTVFIRPLENLFKTNYETFTKTRKIGEKIKYSDRIQNEEENNSNDDEQNTVSDFNNKIRNLNFFNKQTYWNK